MGTRCTRNRLTSSDGNLVPQGVGPPAATRTCVVQKPGHNRHLPSSIQCRAVRTACAQRGLLPADSAPSGREDNYRACAVELLLQEGAGCRTAMVSLTQFHQTRSADNVFQDILQALGQHQHADRTARQQLQQLMRQPSAPFLGLILDESEYNQYLDHEQQAIFLEELRDLKQLGQHRVKLAQDPGACCACRMQFRWCAVQLHLSSIVHV